jgi:hypothetical protein
VQEGARLRHEFPLEVCGTEPLVVDAVRADCGCTAARFDVVGADGARVPYEEGSPLAPGTALVVDVTFDTTGKPGEGERVITLYCNEPDGRVRLTIAADVRSFLLVEPALTSLERMSVTERRELALTVRSAEGERFALAFDDAGVPAAVSATLEPDAPDAAGRAARWRARVTIGPGMPAGPRVLPLRFVSDVRREDGAVIADGAPRFIEALVAPTLVVDPAVILAPRALDFGTLAGDETVARSVRVVCTDPGFALPEPSVELLPLEEGDPLPLRDTAELSVRPADGQADAWDVQLLLQGLSPAVGATFAARLRIATAHPAAAVLEAAVTGARKPVPGGPGGG